MSRACRHGMFAQSTRKVEYSSPGCTSLMMANPVPALASMMISSALMGAGLKESSAWSRVMKLPRTSRVPARLSHLCQPRFPMA